MTIIYPVECKVNNNNCGKFRREDGLCGNRGMKIYWESELKRRLEAAGFESVDDERCSDSKNPDLFYCPAAVRMIDASVREWHNGGKSEQGRECEMKEYKKLEKNALKYMYVVNGIAIAVYAVIFLGVAADLWFGWIFPGIPHRRIVAVVVLALYAALAVTKLLSPKILYHWYRYAIDDEEINIRSGVFVKKTEIVPIERVQKIEVSRGPVERRYGLASVSVVTAGGDVDVRYLPAVEAEEISESLKRKVGRIARGGEIRA